MNALSVTGLLLVLLAMVFAAGCMQTTPPATPTPTAVLPTTDVPTPLPTTLSLTPGPTQTLPEVWALEIQVQSNGVSIDPLITVSVQGGKGLNFIQQVDVQVTRSDGIVETDSILKPLFKGKEVSLRSTTAPGYRDRAEVWAITPQGERVKIFDDYVPFRTYH
jgi:hypothetical protein